MGLALVAPVLVVGCNSNSASRMVTVCGSKIDTSASSGISVVDATKPGTVTVTKIGGSGSALVRLSSDCAHGATVRMVPQLGLRTTFTVPTADEHYAALIVGPQAKQTSIVVTHADGKTTEVRFHLEKVPTCLVAAC